RGAEQAVEVLEHLGHEEPGGPRVEAEAAVLPRAGPAPELVARLEQGDAVAVRGEQGGAREPREAAADHDDLAHGHRRAPSGSTPQRTASASLTRVGTEMRSLARRSAGVRSMRRSSSANT